MSHISEESTRLEKEVIQITSLDQLKNHRSTDPYVYLFHFPYGRTDFDASQSSNIYKSIDRFCSYLPTASTVCILTTPPDAARMLPFLERHLKFQLWIAVEISSHKSSGQRGILPENHAALLVLTPYKGTLRHTKTRIRYTYCSSCGKTTKDYGGKKHTYHEDGTLLSDVWRDTLCNPSQDIEPVTDRLQDLFGLEEYHSLKVLDLRSCSELAQKDLPERASNPLPAQTPTTNPFPESRLLNEDCLAALAALPDNSVDFCFADPPYNLKKKYSQWQDSMELVDYFKWCDQWLGELSRVLKPGGTLAILNIPLWAVRHYQYLCSRTDLHYQNWIVWDAMSFPVRFIMPAHYTILCFSKGTPRPLPGLQSESVPVREREDIAPLSDSFCIRDACIARRRRAHVNDRAELNSVWHDIHRLKHNSHRVDHPCQLPPQLMRRLYALFTRPGEWILDCFNGAGTSTLVAQQMGRKYIGMELSPQYHGLAIQRHEELSQGKDPFGKVKTVPTAKNSRVARLPKQRYKVSKKTLQLDVKRIAQQLGRLPTHEEVEKMSKYSINYYDNYFISWGEVCAAARTTGMTEVQAGPRQTGQLSLF
jgi:DNA modification methylase